jgi:hypothetical protein
MTFGGLSRKSSFSFIVTPNMVIQMIIMRAAYIHGVVLA